VLIVALILVSAASAVDLDFDAANGSCNVASNWVDSVTGDPSPSLVERFAWVSLALRRAR
jgi:hypothetical protein